MISHQGGRTRDCGAYCSVCRVRAVKFHGASCFMCREEERERKYMGKIVSIFLAVALLVIGFISAHGTWIKINLER